MGCCKLLVEWGGSGGHLVNASLGGESFVEGNLDAESMSMWKMLLVCFFDGSLNGTHALFEPLYGIYLPTLTRNISLIWADISYIDPIG